MGECVPSCVERWSLKHEMLLEVLGNSGSVRMKATGCSMLPAILPYDVLLIEKKSIDQVKPGDVAFVRHDGRFLVHRVIGSFSDGLLTKGDANPTVDALVLPEEFLGCVVSIKRGRKTITKIPVRRKLSWLIANSDALFRMFMYGIAIKDRTVAAWQSLFWPEKAHFTTDGTGGCA